MFFALIFFLLITQYSCEVTKNIVFVHGYQSKPSVWEDANKFFIQKGYKTYLFDYRYTTNNNIESNSIRLFTYLDNNKLVDSEIIFLTHSMGGLVTRKMLLLNPTIKFKLITYATPHYGAPVPNFCYPMCPTKALNDMSSKSVFLKELNSVENLKYFDKNNLLTYSIEHDGIVTSTYSHLKSGLNLVVDSDGKMMTNSTDVLKEELTNVILIHSDIIHKTEVFLNTLNFVENKIKYLLGGPSLKARCNDIPALRDVKWINPKFAPHTLNMNVMEENEKLVFYNTPSSTEFTEDFPNDKLFSFRFFDPTTSTLSEWSNVTFSFRSRKCEYLISNSIPILEWELV